MDDVKNLFQNSSSESKPLLSNAASIGSTADQRPSETTPLLQKVSPASNSYGSITITRSTLKTRSQGSQVPENWEIEYRLRWCCKHKYKDDEKVLTYPYCDESCEEGPHRTEGCKECLWLEWTQEPSAPPPQNPPLGYYELKKGEDVNIILTFFNAEKDTDGEGTWRFEESRFKKGTLEIVRY